LELVHLRIKAMIPRMRISAKIRISRKIRTKLGEIPNCNPHHPDQAAKNSQKIQTFSR